MEKRWRDECDGGESPVVAARRVAAAVGSSEGVGSCLGFGEGGAVLAAIYGGRGVGSTPYPWPNREEGMAAMNSYADSVWLGYGAW